MMDGSVVIPTYNRSGILRFTLSALARQTYPRDRFEVIVVDDGSTDRTVEIVGRFKDRLDIFYLYQRDDGYRLGRARNLGIEHARGEIVMLLDSDMVVCPDYVVQHIVRHRTSEQPVAVQGYIYGYGPGVDRDLLLRCVDFNDLTSSTSILEKQRLFWDPREVAYRKVRDDLSLFPAPWRFFWGGAVSLRRKDLVEVGMFDEDFRSWGGEDTELGYRCFKRGLRFILNRRAWSVHYPHPGDPMVKKQSGRKNLLLFYRKHPNPEIEVYSVTPRFKYNALWGAILDLVGRDLLPDYASDRFRELWGFLKRSPGDRQLVIGCGEGAIVKALHPSLAADFDEKRLQRARSQFPGTEFAWALGVRLPYGDRDFGAVIITDFWRALPRVCVGKLLQETVRLGKEVFVLCTPGFEPPLPEGHLWHRPALLPKLCRRLRLACSFVDSTSLYQISPVSR